MGFFSLSGNFVTSDAVIVETTCGIKFNTIGDDDLDDFMTVAEYDQYLRDMNYALCGEEGRPNIVR